LKLFPAYQRSQRGGYGGAPGNQLFDDTSSDQHGPMPNQQYTGADFLQAPVTNMAFQYGTNMASQGKEYVEKNVSELCLVFYILKKDNFQNFSCKINSVYMQCFFLHQVIS